MENSKEKWWQKEYDPVGALVNKFRGKGEVTEKPPKIPKEMAQAAAAGGAMPDMEELKKSGMMGKFFRHWKNPAFMKQMKAVAARMQAEGVNVKDQKAVQAWIEKNKDAIVSGKLAGGSDAPKQETVRKDGPQIGRNDPCTCGSGKKFKKCCG
jgi:uncharacterized protein YecA (UPF0149 family)